MRLGLGRLLVAGLLFATACREQQTAPGPARAAAVDSAVICGAQTKQVVERFGARLKLVSLLAPDTMVKRTLRNAYRPFVTPELLAQWEASPRAAPGREVSNPWPARIAIRSLHVEGEACVVEGDIVHVETGDTTAILELRPIRLRVQRTDGLRIADYQPVR
jgi:hypothetical protein